MIKFENLSFHWLGHDGFLIKGSKSIVIDPFKVTGNFEPVDIAVSTHEHMDHCHPESLNLFCSADKTHLVGIHMAEEKLKTLPSKKIHLMKPTEDITIEGVKIEAVHAYNLNKFRDADKGIVFHPKEDNKIGVIIELDGVRIYHAGDTDFIPEIENIKVDVALLPVSGTYVMTWEEAVEAANVLQPKLAIPMHYGSGVVGKVEMAEKFKEKATCKVILPTLEK